MKYTLKTPLFKKTFREPILENIEKFYSSRPRFTHIVLRLNGDYYLPI